jgi:tRNA-Thr(GGU) m(6)t(6)A37 methyltransferase TsaA
MKEFKIKPIGFVKVLSEIEINAKNRENIISELIIDKQFEECLEGIEDFSHVLVIFWAHKLSSKQRKIKKVHPRGNLENPLIGVFSTRSQARPNPILITAVKILEREKRIIRVKGLDAYDATPIIDIKPYIPYFDSTEEINLPEWVKSLES